MTRCQRRRQRSVKSRGNFALENRLKEEDLTTMAMMAATNAGGSLGHRRQIAQRSCCLSHLRGSSSLYPLLHFTAGVQHIKLEGLYCDLLMF